MTFKNPFTERKKKVIKKRRMIDNYQKAPNWKHMSSGQKSLYKSYRRSASLRGKTFGLGLLYFTQLTEANCFYCGIKPKQIKGDIVYNGIDRIDNEVGYEYGNVISCCGRCNKAKGTMGFNEFKEWIHTVSSEYTLRKEELSDSNPSIEYLHSRGFLTGSGVALLDESKIENYKNIDHKKPLDYI